MIFGKTNTICKVKKKFDKKRKLQVEKLFVDGKGDRLPWVRREKNKNP